MLCYGYMSPLHMQSYVYIVSAFENQGKACLHNERVTRILDNKLLQGICYAKAQIPIPDTFAGFELDAVRNFYRSNIKDKSIIKSLSDYGGDGVKLSKHPDDGITCVSKMLWNNVQTLTQKFVPDVWGRSIRVLLIKGKASAWAEYQDKSSDFRSNVSYHDNFQLVPITDEKLRARYSEIAEKAALSVDKDITVAGVDILDSKTQGCFVLEINCWPDLYDIEHVTQIPVFNLFIKTFYEKVLHNKAKLEANTQTQKQEPSKLEGAPKTNGQTVHQQ